MPFKLVPRLAVALPKVVAPLKVVVEAEVEDVVLSLLTVLLVSHVRVYHLTIQIAPTHMPVIALAEVGVCPPHLRVV